MATDNELLIKLGEVILNEYNVPYTKVTDVDTCVIYGGYCETCSYETPGFRVSYDGQIRQFEITFGEAMNLYSIAEAAKTINSVEE